MSAPTICTCTLNVRDLLGNNITVAELVCEPRKSFIETSSSNFVIARPQRATAVAGVCTLALVETASSSQYVTFLLNYDDGQVARQVVFNPVFIPNQGSVDLSTILSIQRG